VDETGKWAFSDIFQGTERTDAESECVATAAVGAQYAEEPTITKHPSPAR
jgi:hypothetical protein